MALVLNDRVKETSTTTGNGDITLAGVAAVNFITFNTGIVPTNTTYYAIVNQGVAEWEVGVGTVTNATTLQRDTVLDNSAGTTAKIVFSGGTKDVFCTLPASKAIYLDASTPPVPVGAASTGFALAMAVAL
jgi:hypothetical protein|tara:strand:- start:818 stop:1210 length:393 start_codon:yes stop_codon:yes gene_type:complete